MTESQLFNFWQETINEIKSLYERGEIGNNQKNSMLKIANDAYEIERNKLNEVKR